MTDYIQESIEAYRSALKRGKRFVAEQNAAGRSGLLSVFEATAHERCGELPLGCFDIPLGKIKGTFAAGRQSAFAGNFMPLLEEKTEFASKWISLYAAHLDEGIRDSVRAYEYLGHYYIIEGNKRVSVLASSGAYACAADVTRLLPPRDDSSPEVGIFYEILGGDTRARIGHLWFSQPGRMTKLRSRARGALKKHPEWPSDLIDLTFYHFRTAYHELELSSLPLTTGDAFLQYVVVYGFPVGTPEDELKTKIVNCVPQFEKMNAATPRTLGDPTDLSRLLNTKASLFSIFSGREQRPSFGFVFSGDARSSFFAEAHEAGRLFLETHGEGTQIKSLSGVLEGRAGYDKMSSFIRDEAPDILFATEPRFAISSLRLMLECKATTIMQCQHWNGDSALASYYGRTREPAFLCGVLAGSLTRTGTVGYIQGLPSTGAQPTDLQAFAQGARAVRVAARVRYAQPERPTLDARRDAQRMLAQKGCDILWLPFVPGAAGQPNAFPGAYARLCAVDPQGGEVFAYALTAWHWEAFYARFAATIAEGSLDIRSRRTGFHFRMGLSSGVLRVHALYPALQDLSKNLLNYFTHLIDEGLVSPMDESTTVEVFDET